MAVVMGRLKNKKCIKIGFKGFTIASKKSYISWICTPDGQGRAERFHLSNDARWVLSIQKRIGGPLSISLEKSDWWEIVLTSTMRWPHYTVFTKNLEKNNSGQFHSGNTSNGTHHRILSPARLGGNGTIPVELMTMNKKVRNWAHVKSDMIERRDPLWVPPFHKTSDMSTFNILKVCCN